MFLCFATFIRKKDYFNLRIKEFKKVELCITFMVCMFFFIFLFFLFERSANEMSFSCWFPIAYSQGFAIYRVDFT